MAECTKVVIRETKKIYGLSEKAKREIKECLTVSNPKYLSAVRYSKWGRVTTIPRYLHFFDEHDDCLEIPRGCDYELDFVDPEVIDETVINTVEYPPTQISLRTTQKEAYRAWLEDTDNGIISMSTGKGKSILGIYCAYAVRQKTLVIVHKDDLVATWQKDFRTCFGKDAECGLVKGPKRKIGEQVTIAMIQTLNSWANRDLDGFNEFCQQFGMVIVDEMHHIAGSIYDLINHFPAHYRMGLTATPERSDGLSDVMYWYMGNLAYKFQYTVDDEDILPVTVRTIASKAFFDPQCYKIPTKTKKGGKMVFKYVLESALKNPDPQWDRLSIENVPVKQRPKVNYSEIDEFAVLDERTMFSVTEAIIDSYNWGRNIIVFFSQKAPCYKYYERLIERGVPENEVTVYNGDFSDRELEVKRQAAESGRVRITLATYSIATEGTNVKAWDTAFLVSSINTGKNVEQACGRIRRTKSGKAKMAFVYDVRYPYVYTLKNHKWTRDKRYKRLKFNLEDTSPTYGKHYKIMT